MAFWGCRSGWQASVSGCRGYVGEGDGCVLGVDKMLGRLGGCNRRWWVNVWDIRWWWSESEYGGYMKCGMHMWSGYKAVG